MQFGTLREIQKQGFDVGEILRLNNCAPFWVDKKAQISVRFSKHKQDN